MRKLRFCKRCGEVFEADGKFSRICTKCTKSFGGWHKASQKDSLTIGKILGDRKWVFGAYNKK